MVAKRKILNRSITRCICKRTWLIETSRPRFKGDDNALKSWIKQANRDWNCCYCGEDLYDTKKNTAR